MGEYPWLSEFTTRATERRPLFRHPHRRIVQPASLSRSFHPSEVTRLGWCFCDVSSALFFLEAAQIGTVCFFPKWAMIFFDSLLTSWIYGRYHDIHSVNIYIYIFTCIYCMTSQWNKRGILQTNLSQENSLNMHSGRVVRIYSHGGWLMAMLSLSIGYLSLWTTNFGQQHIWAVIKTCVWHSIILVGE